MYAKSFVEILLSWGIIGVSLLFAAIRWYTDRKRVRTETPVIKLHPETEAPIQTINAEATPVIDTIQKLHY